MVNPTMVLPHIGTVYTYTFLDFVNVPTLLWMATYILDTSVKVDVIEVKVIEVQPLYSEPPFNH